MAQVDHPVVGGSEVLEPLPVGLVSILQPAVDVTLERSAQPGMIDMSVDTGDEPLIE
ncbi:MAG: hypothetical protein ACR2PK_08135 [Acidimicrobiales bacterium]